eukprot:10721143-Karenia_brevis.AAC.1
MRSACEERIDKECNDLHRDIDDSHKESHAAQPMGQASHRNNSDEMKHAIVLSRGALSRELNNHTRTSWAQVRVCGSRFGSSVGSSCKARAAAG